MKIKKYIHIRSFTFADALTSLGLVFGWAALTFVLVERVFIAIILNSSALILDLLDGYVARKQNTQSTFGTRFDSFVDSINYLVFPLILYSVGHAEQTYLIIIGGACTMLCGILRLVTWSGSEESGKGNGELVIFSGFTVPHAFFIVMGIFWAEKLLSVNLSLLFLFLAVLVSFLMISTFPIKKSKINYMIFIGLTVVNLSLSVWQLID